MVYYRWKICLDSLAEVANWSRNTVRQFSNDKLRVHESFAFGGVDLSIEVYFLLLEHLLEDLCGLGLAVAIVEVGLVYGLEQQVDLFEGLGAICVEDAQD
jgi:hypothetical protein